MFDRVVMDVKHMPLPIVLVVEVMLPEAALPNALLPLGALRWAGSTSGQTGREFTLDDHPARGKVRISLRQTPDRMEMVGQHHDGFDGKRASLMPSRNGFRKRSI